MGHQRLGDIPKSRKWSAVVAAVAAGPAGGGTLPADVEDLADRTLDAAEVGLTRCVDDPGLRYTFYLLTQIALAARERDWSERLARLGIRASEHSSLYDLTAGLQAAIDEYVWRHGGASDVSEMAQQAAGDAISRLAGPATRTLFGDRGEVVQEAVRNLSTKVGFARLGQQFFGCFLTRFLNFYLSRVTAGRVGDATLPTVGSLSGFNDALDAHCRQSAQILHDFCGEWFSKTEYERGIDLQNATGFLAVALRKLQAELGKQKEGQ